MKIKLKKSLKLNKKVHSERMYLFGIIISKMVSVKRNYITAELLF